MARSITIQLPDTLWRALAEHSDSSGQSIHHIVTAALAEALDVDHHSLFQVSTSGAVVRGLYQGCVTVADLRRHGDLGLGTFEDLDGEMILIDGHCFQARVDGSVTEAPDSAMTPFATVTSFHPDATQAIEGVTSLAELTRALDDLRPSPNTTVAFRITGMFPSMTVRAACKHESGIGLVDATADQGVFDFADISGTILGFWTPDYARAIGVAGYHLHAIDDDRTRAGHLLEVAVSTGLVEFHLVNDIHLAIPETQAFLAADLSGDLDTALDIAERSTRRGSTT